MLKSIHKFYARVVHTMTQNPGMRHGQACYNVLHDVDPKLALEINGTENDPFYDDSKVNNLFVLLASRWGEDVSQ